MLLPVACNNSELARSNKHKPLGNDYLILARPDCRVSTGLGKPARFCHPSGRARLRITSLSSRNASTIARVTTTAPFVNR